MKKELGKISKITLGYGGYQDEMFGLSIKFDSENFSACDFIPNSLDFNVATYINQLCDDSKVEFFHELINMPVQIIFDSNNRLSSWRILKEVL